MATETSARSWPYAAGLVAIVVVFGAIALFGGGGSSDDFEVTAPESVQGGSLADFSSGGQDPAVGSQAPVATGEALLDEGTVTVPAPGEPTIIVFLAHWCPHCQAEVPVMVRWMENGGPPEGVALRAVATAIDESRGNYPPDEWLQREGWTVPTVVDDGSIANAYGLGSFPYWVVVDAQGNVVGRHSGELPAEQLDAIASRLAS